MKNSSSVQTYSTVDYLTVTTPSDSVGSKMYYLASEVVATSPSKFGQRRNWHDRHYVGFAVDGMQHGYSAVNQGYLIRLVGEMAQRYWKDFARIGGKATRIDLQTTVILPAPVQGLIRSTFDEATLKRGSTSRPKMTMYENADPAGGDTVYIGSRQSKFYGRLYDKARQGKMAEWAIDRVYRYEVEVKQDKANEVMSQLLALVTEGMDYKSAIRTFVYNWFRDRWIQPSFSTTDEAIISVDGITLATSIERKLEWLRTQVAPTVARLSESGFATEAAEGLGFGYITQNDDEYTFVYPTGGKKTDVAGEK